jgi:ABC-type dipeptide/oligopeptide/nickel transport system permease subunit
MPGPSLVNMIIVLVVGGRPVYTRVILAETLSIREREFVVAGRSGPRHGSPARHLVVDRRLPGLAIFVTTLAINLMGNALRDWLDPHLKL